jgi:hypothetical protein
MSFRCRTIQRSARMARDTRDRPCRHRRQRPGQTQNSCYRRSPSAALAGKVVDIYDFPDGRLEIRWKGLPLSYSVFDHLQRVSHAAIVENKRLGEVLAWIKQQQDKQPHHRGGLAGPGGQAPVSRARREGLEISLGRKGPLRKC